MALYVIQVAGGKESRVVELIDKFVSEGLVRSASSRATRLCAGIAANGTSG